MKVRVKILVSIFLAFLLLVGCDATSVSNQDDNNANQKDEENNDNKGDDNDNVTYPIEVNEEFKSLYLDAVKNYEDASSLVIEVKSNVVVDGSTEYTKSLKVSTKEELSKIEASQEVDYENIFKNDEKTKITYYLATKGDKNKYYERYTNYNDKTWFIERDVKTDFIEDNNSNGTEGDQIDFQMELDVDNLNFKQVDSSGELFVYTINLSDYKDEHVKLFETLETYIVNEDYLNQLSTIDMYIKFDLSNKTISSISYNFDTYIDGYNKMIDDNNLNERKILKFDYSVLMTDYNNVVLEDINEDNTYVDQPDSLSHEMFILNEYQIDNELKGTIDHTSDVDYFKVNITDSGKYYFQVSADVPIVVDVYDMNDKSLRDYIYLDGSADYVLKNFALDLELGSYYFKVEAVDANVILKDYNITVSKIEDDDISDTYLGGKYRLISDKGMQYGTINYDGDIDVYAFNTFSSGIAEIKVNTVEDIVLMYFTIQSDGTIAYQVLRPYYDVMTLYYFIDAEVGGYFAITSDSYIGDYTLDIVIYDDSSDIPDEKNENSPSLEIGEKITDANHRNSNDSDSYIINVTEDGRYNINFQTKGLTNYNYSVYFDILDLDGNIIDHGMFTVNPNILTKYPVKMKAGANVLIISLYKPDIYTLSIEKNIDDNTTYKTIDLENINSIQWRSDHEYDCDEFRFTITEPMYYTFDLDGSRMSIYNEVGNSLPYDIITNSYYFYPGNYSIKLYYTSDNYINYRTVRISKDPSVVDDYDYKMSDDDSNIGVLQFGDNILYVNYEHDRDSYKLVVLETGNYRIQFDLTYTLEFYQSIDDKQRIKSSNYLVNLEEGIYYLDFYYWGSSGEKMVTIVADETDI